MNDAPQKLFRSRPALLVLPLLAATLVVLLVADLQPGQAAARGRWRCCPAPAAPALADDTAARDAVQRLLEAQVAAWNKGDLEGFMAGYWQSPDLTFFSGNGVTRGWQATLERYRARYQGEGREMGKLTFSNLEIEVLGPDRALARGRWQVVKSKETATGLFTLLLKQLPEGWLIVHDHTSA